MAFAAFLIRFLAYALVTGATFWIAQDFWNRFGLDGVAAFTDLHALGITLLTFAPFVLALVAIVARPLAVFALFYIVGAVLTAPFALARFVSG